MKISTRRYDWARRGEASEKSIHEFSKDYFKDEFNWKTSKRKVGRNRVASWIEAEKRSFRGLFLTRDEVTWKELSIGKPKRHTENNLLPIFEERGIKKISCQERKLITDSLDESNVSKNSYNDTHVSSRRSKEKKFKAAISGRYRPTTRLLQFYYPLS